jgi:hypothetical protein
MTAPVSHLELTTSFTPEEFAMLARIVDEGMWQLASTPHTAEDERLWDMVCAKLQMPGYIGERA